MSTKAILLIFFGFLYGASYGQHSEHNVSVGDTFILQKSRLDDYKYVNFPKPNFIIKKGGVLNNKSLKGQKVEVISIKEKQGALIATLELYSNRSFFGSHKQVTVHLDEAIQAAEIAHN